MRGDTNMFIYVEENNDKMILHTKQIRLIEINTVDPGKSTEEIKLIMHNTMDDHIMASISISEIIKDLLPMTEVNEMLNITHAFGRFLLIKIMKHINSSVDLILDHVYIRKEYMSFSHQQYNEKRAGELSELNINDGIGKEIVDCFIDREKDFKTISTDYYCGLTPYKAQMAVANFFENELKFRNEFDIPIDPNDKKGIDKFNRHRQNVLSSTNIDEK